MTTAAAPTKPNLVQAVKGALSVKKPSVGGVWNALFSIPAPAPELVEKVVLPAKVVPTPAQEQALEALPELLAAMNWPTVRRVLKPAERRAAVELLNALRDVEALAKATRESLRTTVLNDGDVQLEADGKVDELTPRDKDGHYVVSVEGSFAFDTLATSIDRSATAPKVSIGATALEARIGDEADEDTITRREYLAVTESVRVLVEGDLLRFLARNPERAKAFLGAASLSGGSLSMLEKTKNAS